MENTNEFQDKFFSLNVKQVTLTLEDEDVLCEIITLFESEGKEYIVLLPLDENGENEDGDVWIYEFKRDTDGGDNHELINIEEDEEYERVADLFDEWLDTQEFLSMDEN